MWIPQFTQFYSVPLFNIGMNVVSFIQSSSLKTLRFVQLLGLLAYCSLQLKNKWNGVLSASPHSHIGEAQSLNFHFISASFTELPIRNSQIFFAVYESPYSIGETSINAGTLAVRFVRKESLNPPFNRLCHWLLINPAFWSLVYSTMVSFFKNFLFLLKLDYSELAWLRGLLIDFMWVSRTRSSFSLILMTNLIAIILQCQSVVV